MDVPSYPCDVNTEHNPLNWHRPTTPKLEYGTQRMVYSSSHGGMQPNRRPLPGISTLLRRFAHTRTQRPRTFSASPVQSVQSKKRQMLSAESRSSSFGDYLSLRNEQHISKKPKTNCTDTIMSPEKSRWRSVIWPALVTFKELKGHLMVPSRFVIPENVQWDRSLWGLRLGRSVDNIRRLNAFNSEDFHNQLNEIDFVWNVSDYTWKKRILPSLKCYIKMYGDLHVSQKFVVPEQDCSWPRSCWGLKLGMTVHNIRNGGYKKNVKRDMALLQSLGFVWRMNGGRKTSITST